MNTKAYNIKIPGNSGCGVEIISYCQKPAVRKWTSSDTYAERLRYQREKQLNFLATIKGVYAPKILHYDAMSFVMEYLHMLDFLEFIEIARPQDIKRKFAIIIDYISEELKMAEHSVVKSSLFLEKLCAIERSVPLHIWQKYYEHHVRKIRNELPESFIVPIGRCHGDLTFSNIMISLENDQIGIFDFLDSFLESPIVDIVKIRQDTKFNWTNQRYKMPHDTTKISMIMSWLDEMVEAAFNEVIDGLCFNVVEKLNYLRIAPYVQSISEHEYLSNSLAMLNTK